MGKKTGGAANSFQRDYLEANLKGTSFKGSKVESVSNKHVYTEDGNSYSKKGLSVSFEEKEGTENMGRPGPRRD